MAGYVLFFLQETTGFLAFQTDKWRFPCHFPRYTPLDNQSTVLDLGSSTEVMLLFCPHFSTKLPKESSVSPSFHSYFASTIFYQLLNRFDLRHRDHISTNSVNPTCDIFQASKKRKENEHMVA